MNDNIERYGDLAAFAASRTPAWHEFGVTADHDMTIEEGMTTSHCSGWDVTLEPAFAVVGTTPETMRLLPVEGRAVTTRRNPFTGDREALAVVSDRYVVIQNEALAEFAVAVADDSDLIVDAIGSLNGGRRVFITFRTPDALTAGDTDDKVQPYLVLASSHDASLKFTAQCTSIRVVCQNTLGAMLGEDTAQRFQVRHFGGESLDGRIAEAREALGVVFASGTALEAEMAKLVQRDLTAREFDAIVKAVWPLDDDAPANTAARVRDAQDTMRAIYNGPTVANVAGTAWAALNAATEQIEYFANSARSDESRFDAALGLSNGLTSAQARAAAAVRRVVLVG